MHTPVFQERIAVTGMAICNALGSTLDEVWRHTLDMRSGMRALEQHPEDPPGFFAPPFETGSKSYCHVLAPCRIPLTRQDLGLPPQDFQAMSASARLTLLVAAQAMADSGLAAAGYAPERVGVFVSQNAGEAASTLWDLNCNLRAGWIAQLAAEHGHWDETTQNSFRDALRRGRLAPDESTMLCRLGCTAAGMICRTYGFEGPAFSVGAACSSSMAALFTALQMLRGGVIDAAVIGGGEETYSPLYMAEFCAMGALARSSEFIVEPQDYCRPFDVHRNGFVLGEGAAMLVLERESTARRRGASMHGLLTGAGSVTNTRGLIEPSAAAQVKAIRASFAGLDYGPDAVQMVECHATATVQGDLEEGRALAEVYGNTGSGGLVLSAYKAQVGHTTGASGAMSLIHGLLSMHDGVFPGTRNCTQPDPAIPLASAGLRLPAQPEDWPRPASGIRRMQVNSFAFGGACFALHVEEPNDRQPARIQASVPDGGSGAASGFDGEEAVVDGVRMVRLTHQGQDWRLGSVTPAWLQEIATLPAALAAGDLAALERRGVWLRPATPPPTVAIMCCGQGSVWPGMGRALYDTFPAARAAMDRIAAGANWDVLGLLDEKSLDKIILTRWQQPYLFLLEFAQASYLESLGFKANVMSGHSLGELIALCLAGVYTPEQAWHILDTRAQQMAHLEASSDHSTGMMAVYGATQVIEDTLRNYPDLLVSNYNSPTQFILSGPRDTLTEARRALRKSKVPAVLLNMTMAFHHPGMRVLRETSLQRLNEVDMRPARMPMLSNITTGLYPDDRPSICEYIADLDENAVRWVECVHNMWNIHNVRHFVELGPTDTLCGLTADIQPDAVCVPAGRKDKEVEGMRAAVARLYALGHLPRRAGHAVAAMGSASCGAGNAGGAGETGAGTPAPHGAAAPSGADMPQAAPQSGPAAHAQPVPPHVEDIMPLIMEATGYERKDLAPDMDLRHDLAIRSSRFPVIMHAAERCFQISVRFEDLMGVATIRDLADTLARLRNAPVEEQAAQTPAPALRDETKAPPPVLRYLPTLSPLDMPLPVAACPFGPALVVGSTALARRWADLLRALPGDTPVFAAKDAAEALEMLRSAASGSAAQSAAPAPRALILALEEQAPATAQASPDMPCANAAPPPCADPTAALLQCQELLQAFLRRKDAAFCLACMEHAAQEPAATPLFSGLTGLLLSAALEYPRAVFRSVLAHTTADSSWLPRALNPAPAPIQWIASPDGTAATPQLRARPADPAACGLPLAHGDVIVVSGGGRGITPRALEGLAPMGCTFVLLGRSPALPPDVAARLESLGARVRYESCDITDSAQVTETLAGVRREFGRIDGLLHAAGLNRDATLDALSREDMEAVLAVKCRGLHALLHAATPHGLRWAVAFSSLAGWLGNYGQSNYSAANRAMAALLSRWGHAHALSWRCVWLPPVTGEGMAQSEDVREQLRLRGLENAWIDAAELGLLLARELRRAEGGHVLWARALPTVPGVRAEAPASAAALRGLAERPKIFPLVYPLALEGGVPCAFTGAHDFSHFSDACLRHAAQGGLPGGTPRAPAGLLLRCLLESAVQPAAWLEPVGMEDVRLFEPVLCPPGVTRESRIRMHAQNWRTAEPGASLTAAAPDLPPAALPLLPWSGEMQVRDISANGRRQDRWSTACSGTVLLAPCTQALAAELPPLWTPAPCAQELSAADHGEGADASPPVSELCGMEGMPLLRPLLRPLTGHGAGEDLLRFSLNFFRTEDIAGRNNPRYYQLAVWLEIFQRALGGLRVKPCRVASLKELRYVALPLEAGRALLEVRPAAASDSGPLFDAQAVHENGTLLATARGMALQYPDSSDAEE